VGAESGHARLIYGLLKHGLSTSEIADELSLDYNSVRVLAHRIRRPRLWNRAVAELGKAGRKAIPTTSACAPTTASSACSTAICSSPCAAQSQALFWQLKPKSFLLERKKLMTEASWQSEY